MADSSQAAPVSAEECDALRLELQVCRRQLGSKDEALRILKGELDSSQHHSQGLEQELVQLRSQLSRSPANKPELSDNLARDKEHLIAQLEEAQEKITSLEREVHSAEDEKEEVECERDYYSRQCTSLKRCIEEQENARPPSQTALANLMEENRRLKLDLVEAQSERDQALSRIDRYKGAVERRKLRESQSLHFADRHQDMKQSMKRTGELESLSNSLAESVKEKSIALQHQKKANKMLATRIAELEHKLRVLEISGLWSGGGGLELTWGDGGDMLTPEKPQPVIADGERWGGDHSKRLNSDPSNHLDDRSNALV